MLFVSTMASSSSMKAFALANASLLVRLGSIMCQTHLLRHDTTDAAADAQRIHRRLPVANQMAGQPDSRTSGWQSSQDHGEAFSVRPAHHNVRP